MTEHETVEQTIAAYVLGAATSSEAEFARRHLDGCGSCLELAARLRRATDALALTAEPVQPPARLRSRVLAAALATPQMETAGERRPVVPFNLDRRRRFPGASRALSGLAAAAAAVAIAVGATYAVTSHTATQPAQVARFSLVGSGGLRTAQATVVDLKQDGIAVVDFRNMPGLGSDKVYEFWLITPAGRADPAGVFRPQEDGTYVLVLTKPLAGYRTAGVTTEEGPNGSTFPTQQPQLAGTLS